jgi:predicted transcriptional regulator YdeE
MVGPERVRRDELRIVGVEAWTSNRREAEEDTAAIPALWRRFLGEGLERRIPDRTATGRICAVYTDTSATTGAATASWSARRSRAWTSCPPGWWR